MIAVLLTGLELRGAQFTLTWSDNSRNESGFRVERATGSSGAFAQIASTGANVTRYVDPNLAASTLYRYRVRAYNAAGTSGYSNTVSGTTPAAGSNTPPASGNTAPTVSSIANRSIPANGSSGTIAFTIGDAQTSASQLKLTRTSSNTALVPVNNIVLGGSGANRTVRVTPLTNTTGTATITVAVSDGRLTTSRSFTVTVAMALSYSDLGSPARAGSQTIRGSTIQLRGAGIAIGGRKDQFRLGRQSISGDAEATVRVASLTNTHASAAAGLMFRRDLSAGAAFVFVHVTPSNRVVLQYRATAGGTAVTKRSVTGTRPRWLRLERTGNTYRAYHSSNGSTWTLIDTVSVTLGTTAHVGVAVCSHNATSIATGVFDNLALGRAYAAAGTASSTTSAATAASNSTSAVSAEGGTTGAPADSASSGSSGSSKGTPTISSIATQFIATNASSAVLPFTIGDDTTAASRLTVTARSSNTALVPNDNIFLGGSGAARTVRIRPLTNSSGAATITLTVSDGTHTRSTTFDVIVSMALTFSDIGKPSVAGSQTYVGDRITVRAAGRTIGGKADQFRFGRQYIDGDSEMTVRVSSFSNTDPAAMAGLMFRASLSGNAHHVFLGMTPAGRIVLQYRTKAGLQALTKRMVTARAPRWLKLTRVHDTLYAFHSGDGETWDFIDSVTVDLPRRSPIGIAVCSGNASRRSTAVFDELTLD